MSNCRNTRKMPCYNIREVAPRGPPQLAASAAPASAWRASVPRDRAARTVVAVDAPPRAERTSESARLHASAACSVDRAPAVARARIYAGARRMDKPIVCSSWCILICNNNIAPQRTSHIISNPSLAA